MILEASFTLICVVCGTVHDHHLRLGYVCSAGHVSVYFLQEDRLNLIWIHSFLLVAATGVFEMALIHCKCGWMRRVIKTKPDRSYTDLTLKFEQSGPSLSILLL